MKILLVDDKAIVLKTIAKFLEEQGHIVESAMNGLAAFELINQHSYDLFIIDHLMPLMDGITLVKNLKQLPNLSSIPIIFMSTQDVKGVTYLREHNLVNYVMSKPIDFIVLKEIINSCDLSNAVNLSL